MWISA